MPRCIYEIEYIKKKAGHKWIVFLKSAWSVYVVFVHHPFFLFTLLDWTILYMLFLYQIHFLLMQHEYMGNHPIEECIIIFLNRLWTYMLSSPTIETDAQLFAYSHFALK